VFFKLIYEHFFGRLRHFSTVGSFFQPLPGVKHPSASPSSMPFLAGSVIFQPMARCRAPVGSFFNRWHAAEHPSGHFSTDGTLPSTRRLIFQPMACCHAHF
jgi:hypothetical protein